MYEENNYPCKLINKNIWDSECYDIQMVRCNFINPKILDFNLDKNYANNICEKCSFNQLKQLNTANASA